MRTADTQLLERWICERDSEAFHELVRRHAGLVLGVCRRILGNATDSEDVAQECFFELARTRRPPSRSVGGWLHSLATHRSIDHIKSNVRRRRREEVAGALRERETASDSEWQRIRPHVDEAVEQLPERLRIVIVAHFLQQKTHRVVAEELGLSRQTVTHRVAQAIERIRGHLKRRGVTVASTALAAALGEHALATVPRSFVESVGTMSLAHVAGSATTAAAPSATSPGILHGAWLTVTTTTKLWTAGGVAAALLLLFALLIAVSDPFGGDPPADSSSAAPGRDGFATATPTGEAAAPSAEEPPAIEEAGEATATPASELDRTIRGRVVDDAGEPVPDARVAAGPARERRLAETIAGAGGAFEVELPESGEYLVRAYDEVAGLALGKIATTGSEDTEIALAPFAAVAGRVIDRTSGEPIESIGISISFFGRASAETSHALSWFDVDRKWHRESLEEGRYRFDHLPAGKYHINFEPGAGGYAVPGYFGVRYMEIDLVPGEQRLDHDIALERGAAISGRILDPSGQPLPGATVNLMSTLHSFRNWPSQDTDAMGRYRFEGLGLDGAYIVVVDHEDHAQGYSEPITVAEPKPVSGVDIQLLQGHELAGRVVDEDGTGVADARVSLSRDFGRSLYGFGRRPVHTDEKGAFVFDEVAPGSYNLVVRAEGFNDNRVRTVDVGEDGASGDLRITLRGRPVPGFVAGRITNRDGRPLRGVRVLIHSLTRGVRVGGEERTDEDGRYRFEGIGRAQSFTVSVYPDDYSPAERNGVALGDEDVDFVLVPHGAVAGRVVDARTGEPVRQFEIRTISYRRDTRKGYAQDWIPVAHEDGEFLLDSVEPPSSSVGVRAAGYAPGQSERLEIEPGGLTELELKLEPGATFSGRVVDAASGQPVAGARVRVHDESYFDSSLLRDRYGFPEGEIGGLEVTGGDGRFAFESLTPGASFGAAVWHAGHGTRVLPRLRAPETMEIALEPEARLAVTVVEGGMPVEDISVSIARPGDEARRLFRTSKRTDRQGEIELEGLPSGPFTLKLYRHPDPPIAFRPIELRSGETRRLQLDVAELRASTGVIRGTFVGLEKRATVWIQPRDSEARFGFEGCSAEEPTFTLTGLPPGSYVLHVRGVKGALQQAIEVQPGGALDLSIDAATGDMKW